jgi:hypothetical protein
MGMGNVHARKMFCGWLFLIGFSCVRVRAQKVQFLPEVDAHLKLNSTFRAYLEAKYDRDGGDPTQFTIDPSIQFYPKPLIKIKTVPAFDTQNQRTFAKVESSMRINDAVVKTTRASLPSQISAHWRGGWATVVHRGRLPSYRSQYRSIDNSAVIFLLSELSGQPELNSSGHSVRTESGQPVLPRLGIDLFWVRTTKKPKRQQETGKNSIIKGDYATCDYPYFALLHPPCSHQ